MPLRNPVITGTGILCALGAGPGKVWQAVREGRSSLGPLTLFASARYGAHPVGQVRADVDRLAAGVRGSRSDKLAWLAARQALQEAGWKPGTLAPERMGVQIGATIGGMLGTERFLSGLLREKRSRFGALRFHECAGAADLCARLLGAAGPCGVISTACSSGSAAIAVAAEMIESGQADFMLAGGADSLSRLTLNGFGSLLLLDPKGCRPFDARRAGISLGEGAGMLVMEAEETARARGATILARLSGWGTSCDAWHATAPHPEGRGALSAMRRALERAGLEPRDIDFVAAHGTATPDNDAMESRALRELFKDRLPPVASMMRFFGHTLAASGALKAVMAVQCLNRPGIPASPGFEEMDPKLGIEPVREFLPRAPVHILSNSFGFGGNNAALVFSAASAARKPVISIAPPTRLAVVGAGALCGAGPDAAAFWRALAQGGAPKALMNLPAGVPPGRVAVHACVPVDDAVIDPAKRRRLSLFQQRALAAARQCLAPELLAAAPAAKMGVAIGTGLGALNDTAAFLENMVLNDERAPRPLLFSNSVHNSLAGQLAAEYGFQGLNLTSVQRGVCFESALAEALREVASGRAPAFLAGAADELNPYHLAAGRRWGWWSENTPPCRPLNGVASAGRPPQGEGVALFALAGPELASQCPPLAWVAACRTGRIEGPPDPVAEALWIQDALLTAGVAPDGLDMLLTGASSWETEDRFYGSVGAALSRLAGRAIPCGAYKQACGDFPAASAFGFLAAIGLVSGRVPPASCLPAGAPAPKRCQLAALYTVSNRSKALCVVCA